MLGFIKIFSTYIAGFIKVHGRAKYKPVFGGSILSAVSLGAVAVRLDF
jgi:hypothetical protein